MDSDGKHNRQKLSAFPGRVSVQESEDNVILPTSSSDSPELGTEVLTRILREVLEKVFEARISGESVSGAYILNKSGPPSLNQYYCNTYQYSGLRHYTIPHIVSFVAYYYHLIWQFNCISIQ
ncbi:hypothetical protein J1N35_029691 [Gossypium stocksii]|uniref:Uncharacterized protein n=1 Tax=Gossypium stocksii TaxID=47602 RepID=A0A9D3ZU10_9ROSI|nr:hypothetical protein J1N35_029691 [Gossypium stocksii]